MWNIFSEVPTYAESSELKIADEHFKFGDERRQGVQFVDGAVVDGDDLIEEL